jgi:anti-sigma B factor antagonist
MTLHENRFIARDCFGVQASIAQDTALLRLSGELDLSTVGQLREQIFRSDVLDACEVRVDLSGITFLDSSGIGVVVTACKQVRAAGGSFSVICVPPGIVRRLFELNGLADYLELEDAP